MTRRLLRLSLLAVAAMVVACDGGEDGRDAGTGVDAGVVEQDAGVPLLSISDAEAVEGTDGGASRLTFTVTLSQFNGSAVSVSYATEPGTAQSDDFKSTQATLEFTAAEPKTISVELVFDDHEEEPETVRVVLSNPVGAELSKSVGVGTIQDDDPQPTVSVADVSVSEADGQLVFKAALSNPSSKQITVAFATADAGTAAVDDYTAASGTLTFAPGDVSASAIVPVTSDVLDEDDETVALTLTAPKNATLGDAEAVGIITDDDASPALTINDVSVVEGDTGTAPATFTVTLSAASGRVVTVDWSTGSGTAMSGTDFVAGSGSLSFAPGVTAKSINVTVNADTAPEANETFTVTLANAVAATLPNAPGTGTINNDDLPLPSVSVSDASAQEGIGLAPLMFTVTLSAAYNKTVTVDYGCIQGTAQARGIAALGGQDFNPVSGTLSFAPGETSKSFTVNANGDAIHEPDETFTVVIGNQQNATLGDSLGTGTILNDEALPYLSFMSATVTETNAGSQYAQFGVSSSVASSTPFTVNFATSDETATAADNDYLPVSGTVTFEPGASQYPIHVPVNSDTTPEGNELFRLIGSSPVGATLGQFYVGSFIYNDDTALPQVVIGKDVSVIEGSSGARLAVFDVTLSAPSGQTVAVSWTTVDTGSATAGSDFTAAGGVLAFTPGQTSKTVQVSVAGDSVAEPDETFRITLSSPNNATLGPRATATATIFNDEAVGRATMAISDATVAEGNSGTAVTTLTVTLSAPLSTSVTVNYDIAPGTASAGTDFSAGFSTLTFAAGETSRTIPVTIMGDVGDEADETVRVLLSGATAEYMFADDEGVITITDDDATPGLSIADATATEGAPLNFVLSLSAPSGRAVSVGYTLADGTAVHTVTSDSTDGRQDYQFGSGSVTFAAGETTKTLTVGTFDDQVRESANETMMVTLGSANGATITSATATGNITDNEPVPTLTLNDGIVPAEGRFGRSYMQFTVQMGRRVQTQVTVDYVVTSGTAMSGVDFEVSAGTLTWKPGELTRPLVIPVIGDPQVEPDETLTVTISNPSPGVTLARAVGTGTIVNDD